LHIFIAERGKLSIGANNHLRSSNDGFLEFNMPRVAKSYEKFYAFCKKEKVNSALAIC